MKTRGYSNFKRGSTRSLFLGISLRKRLWTYYETLQDDEEDADIYRLKDEY